MKGSLKASFQLCFPRTTSDRVKTKRASSFSSLSWEVGLEEEEKEEQRFLGLEWMRGFARGRWGRASFIFWSINWGNEEISFDSFHWVVRIRR